jgi:hypothetical protein
MKVYLSYGTIHTFNRAMDLGRKDIYLPPHITPLVIDVDRVEHNSAQKRSSTFNREKVQRKNSVP